MLYLVATPIGNLEDITYRAVDTLRNCTYILCEDTRHSRILLNHYHISTPLKSYHKFNEKAATFQVIQDLKKGHAIALVSDAGTPLISDPGLHLVQSCYQEGVPVTALPGPCAAIQALVMSGLNPTPFQFIGFLPKTKTALTNILRTSLHYDGITVCYESPQRIIETLRILEKLSPQSSCAICRELTKHFEEIYRGTAEETLKWAHLHPPRGEIVLLIVGNPSKNVQEWEKLTPQEHVQYMQDTYRLTKQEAIKMVAQLRGMSKRILYNSLIKENNHY